MFALQETIICTEATQKCTQIRIRLESTIRSWKYSYNEHICEFRVNILFLYNLINLQTGISLGRLNDWKLIQMKFDVPTRDRNKEIRNYSQVKQISNSFCHEFCFVVLRIVFPHLRNVISMCSSFLKVRILISRGRTSFYGGATSTFSRSEFSLIFYLQANSNWGWLYKLRFQNVQHGIN